jgi:hypothetical protein
MGTLDRILRSPSKLHKKMPQIRFAVAAPLAKTRLPWATIGRRFRAFSLLLRRLLWKSNIVNALAFPVGGGAFGGFDNVQSVRGVIKR